MTRYFTALITFMFALVIAGLMFDGFDSQQGIAVTVILSFAAAIAAYMCLRRTRKTKNRQGGGQARIPPPPRLKYLPVLIILWGHLTAAGIPLTLLFVSGNCYLRQGLAPS